MTFTIRIRTLPGAPMLCEYECPVHGRFELLVERDANGDPPAWVWCEQVCSDEPHECDYGDHSDERLAELDRRVAAGGEQPYCAMDCVARGGRRAELVVGTTGRGSITHWSANPTPIGRASKSDEWDPRALDTRPLAEGKMTRPEWNKWQKGITRERRHQKRLKSGRKQKRIQVDSKGIT
jgi:hypothetical protein